MALKEIPLPVLVVNFKNYRQSLSEEGLQLSRSIQAAAIESKASVVLAPPPVMLSTFLAETSLPVFSQHVDPLAAENSTGFVTPSSLAVLGCAGSLVNHSEHRVPLEQVGDSVSKLRSSSLLSLVCARDPDEASTLAAFRPDFIAFEPPGLIGSGRAVSKVSPDLVAESVKAIVKASPRTVPLCGAGIVDGSDVRAALALGARGALVSSGIVKSANPYEKSLELFQSLTQ
jgi:triosephosphate isomerase